MGRAVIGIDLGGTAIKLGCFDPQLNGVVYLEVPTPQPSTPAAVLAVLLEGIHSLRQQAQSLGVNCVALGIGTPGPSDRAGRIAQIAINLVDWLEVPLADRLEAGTQLPTVVANDANCAGWGECLRGAGRGFQDLIVLTLGTGVGGAIVLGGQLWTGRTGSAGELGLITLRPEGPICNSGNRGSLEQYASIRAIRRRMGCEPVEMGDRARAGNPEAIAFWQEYGRDLGAGLASLIYVLTPEAVILGGGISASFDLFAPALRQEIEQRVMPTSRPALQILPAQLGNQAGMVGAAQLAWGRWQQQC